MQKNIECLAASLNNAKNEIERSIFGQTQVIEKTLVTLLAGGHALVIGVPGLAKTRLVKTIGKVMGLDAGRIQFTPDLMPSDIIGSEVLEEQPDGKRSFRFLKGAVFCQLLMADEINRASPRTQSALLQAMQEGVVSVAGTSYKLPVPFHVLATQNPIEQEGTYPLPEAQLDRFLMQIDINYPEREAERAMLVATTGEAEREPNSIMTMDDLINAQNLVRQIPVGDSVVNAILDIVGQGRPETSTLPIVKENVTWGAGPRASQALLLAVKAKAVLDGRLAPSLDDVKDLAVPVLQHRMAISFSARADGINIATIIQAMMQNV